MPRWNNWSGRLEDHPKAVRFIRTEEDAAASVISARDGQRSLRVAGAGHSHAPLVVGADEILDISAMAGVLSVDESRKQVWVGAGTPIYMLGPVLNQHGLALHNQGDIDRQFISGATATGTHGTGRSLMNLSSAVTALRLIDGEGNLRQLEQFELGDDFSAYPVHLGALGLVTAIQLQARDRFVLEEQTWEVEGVELAESLDEWAAQNDRLEFFWYPSTDQAQIKTMKESSEPPVYPLASEGSRRALSFEVLPNDRPHRHTEMEFSVSASDGLACFLEVRQLLQKDFPDVVWPVEYRLLREDPIWMSNAFERDTVTISVHQDVRLDESEYYAACERIFRSFGGRPHWGKVNYFDGQDFEQAYPKWADWWAVRDRLDPDGVFLNEYLRSIRP